MKNVSPTLARAQGRRWTLELATTACFVTGMILLLGVSAIAYRTLNLFAETAARVALGHQVQAEAGNLQRAILEMAAARRAFLETREDRLPLAYRAAATRAQEHLEKLTRLTAGNLRQHANVDPLVSLFEGRLERAAESVTPPPAATAGSARGAPLSDEYRRLLAAINEEEEAQLRGSEETARRDFNRAKLALPVGTVGSLFLLSLALFLLNREAGKRQRSVTTLRNTEQQLRNSEQHIRQLNEELEARIQQRTAQFEEANKELESFSYSVSHDLRAPLRHVQGYVEMLKRATEGQLSEKARRYVETIAQASIDMGQLIDDLLDFSRMGRTEMMASRVGLSGLVDDARHRLESATRGRNISWTIAPLPAVVGDAAMIRQVMANLIGNAVKYTRHRDAAKIEIGCAGEERGHVILFVRDNGAGFDMQYADKLFGVFQRLHRVDEFEGTGIGLAIVRRVVVRHGGRVWAEGAVGQGATFYFTLPPATDDPARRTPINR